jgi:8-oxo-dGTP diphosphatase
MQIVTAAIIEKNGRILLARRKRGDRLERKWEFPGGKLEPGETPEACLARELCEEFGIEAEVMDFVGASVYEYGHGKIDLRAYRVRHLSGEFSVNAHEEIAWVRKEDLLSYDLSPADVPIAKQIIECK